MQNLNKKRWIKFCIVGAIGTLPNYIVYNIFNGFIVNIIIPVDIGWMFGIIAGMTTNYILNEVWTWA